MAKIKPLRRHPVFSGLTDHELAVFSKIVEEEEFSADTVLFVEKMKSASFYIIDKGKVMVTTDEDDGRKSLILSSGDTFGEWSLLPPSHHTAVLAKVLEPSKLLVVDAGEYHKFASEFPEIALKIQRELLARIWEELDGIKDILMSKLQEL